MSGDIHRFMSIFSVYVSSSDEHTSLSCIIVLKARCGLKDDSCIGEFFVSKYQNTWQYFLSAPVDRQDPAKKVVSASIILLAEDLNVAKYNALLVLLLQHYLQSYSSVPVLQSYLSAYAAGKAAGPAQGETAPLKWVDSSFDARLSLIAPVHKLIDLVGIEAVLIWVAVLTKKRIVVYHPNAAVVSQLTRAVLALVRTFHMQCLSVYYSSSFAYLTSPLFLFCFFMHRVHGTVRTRPSCVLWSLSPRRNSVISPH